MPAPGEVIAGKFVVERVIGAGGMGVVVAARHQQLGQRVAVKFIREAVAQDSSAVGRFLREARAAAALSSEHVTRVLDVGTLDSGSPFMVMEYLAGDDLGALLKQRGPLPPDDAVGFVLQACEAIAEAHSLGIVHRDLKPSNIFITTDPDGGPLVKLMDFGISKMTDANVAGDVNTLTANGEIMGSPHYMSPEQVRNAKDVDPRSDIWALGVVLFELLAGSPPFLGETLGETFAKILGDPPRPLARLRPELPAGLVAVIAQCLEKSLDRRMQSVVELAPRLEPFAGPQAGRSVDRIRRFGRLASRPSEGSHSPAAAARFSRAPERSSSATPPSLETVGAPTVETGPAWLRSAARREPVRRSFRGFGAAVMVGILLSAVALAVYVARDHGPAPMPAAGSVPAAPSLTTVRLIDIPGVQPTPPSAKAPLVGDGEPLERPATPPMRADVPDSGGPLAPAPARRVYAAPASPPPLRKSITNASPPSSNSAAAHETDVF